MTAVLMAPALIVGGAFLVNSAQRERQAVENQLIDTTRALALGVDRQIGQDKSLLAALSTSPLFQNGAWSDFDAQARASTAPGVWIVVRRPDGQFLVNTALPRGAPMPRSQVDPRAFQAFQSNNGGVSNVFIGSTGHPQVIVGEHVPAPGGTKIQIATSRLAESLGSILQAQKLPPTWVGALVDGGGSVVARSRDSDRFTGKPATSDLIDALQHADEGVTESAMLDGTPSLLAFSRAPETGWAVVVAMPRSELLAATRQSLGWAAFIGFALLTGGLAVAAWVAEGVVRPIEAVADYAGWLGIDDGEAHPRPRTGLSEADKVSVTLARSAIALREREDELRRLNATLETRISERTRELAETTENLIQAQKLEAVGRLTGGIAHDFNNLLTAVQGNLELLARRVSDDRLSSYIDRARQAAERGAKLTAQLLAFSRRQRLEPEPLDINALVGTASQLLASTLGGTVRVDLVLARDLWPALADATQLELIILNLAINARDAMPTGGLITIHTENRRIEAHPERPEAPPAGEYVALSVGDTGDGMTAEVLARVFEPFFTTKEVGRGSGLGLPQVLGVAKQLGGGVEIISRPGAGAKVTVFLPRAKALARRSQPPPADVSHRLEGLCVLLVDDDPDVRGVAGAMLTEFGCKVRDAASGQSALDALAADAAVDVVLLDYAMAGMNGAEAAAHIRRRWPETPVLLMSGYADVGALADAWTGPFLHKPFTAARLSEQLVRVLSADTVVRLRPARG